MLKEIKSSLTEKINIVWFKRDLRLEDNESLSNALQDGLPILLLYLYEEKIWKDPHYSERHHNFIKETILELNNTLAPHDLIIKCVRANAIPFFEKLFKQFSIETIFSSEETGLQITFERDLEVADLCRNYKVNWKEFQNNGVLRGIKNRNDWKKSWYGYMQADQFVIPENISPVMAIDLSKFIDGEFSEMDLAVVDHEFQKGGRKNFELWRDSFFEERSAHYNDYISKPLLSQYGCSRLSPYIAFGVCSIREVYQLAMHYVQRSSKKQLSAFISRLRWQSHFIQKFESEPRMEFEAVNKGFLNLPYAYNPDYVTAWKNGQTGFPLVDAALRCVVATGYLNFRMRAMVTSFLTHHLFQHFTTGSAWLARQFLDFEPGIHYGQFQMQAGLTGTNTVRVYNPVKNATDHDPEAKFIKQWIPALTALPVQFAIAPWEMTPMEEQMYGVKLGEDYPHRIVDLKKSRAYALDQLYGNRKTKTASLERLRILEKHTIRKPSERDDAKQI